MQHKHRIIVGLSGGVDSAVAALLLQQQGHDVEALFMKNWDEDDEPGYCPAAEDLKDATAICKILDIRLHTVSFSAEYWDRVFDQFLQEYKAGRTPNPDIRCNSEIKFRAFLDYALELDADYIATGHYARIGNTGRQYQLLPGADANKDQSYFLHLLTQEQLARSMFPIGHLDKPEVRRLADEADFANHDKKDSTGICFIGERKFRNFLQQYLPSRAGEIKNLDSEVIGTHQGASLYTVGQREGLGIGGRANSSGEAWYVVDKDVKNNILWAVQGAEHPALYSSRLSGSAIHWIGKQAPQLPLRCKAKIRYRQTAQDCTASLQKDDTVEVTFDAPQRAVTPGQSVVFYDHQQCLGGAVIDTTMDAFDSADALARNAQPA